MLALSSLFNFENTYIKCSFIEKALFLEAWLVFFFRDHVFLIYSFMVLHCQNFPTSSLLITSFKELYYQNLKSSDNFKTEISTPLKL